MPKKKTSKKSKVTKTPVKKTVKKAKPPVVAAPPVVVAPPPVTVTLTESQVIWEEVRNRPIQMFGLPSQTIDQHCTVVPIEPTALYVSIRSSATLPSLEAAVAPEFTVELVDKFVVIRRVPKPLIPSKRR